jgi:hypothetical protein
MLPLNEQAMIAKVNTAISQMGLGPEYRVYKVRAAPWGIMAYWIPQGAEKSIVGSGPYLCHKNGVLKEYNEVAHRNNLHPMRDQLEVVAAFVREAETRIRQ